MEEYMYIVWLVVFILAIIFEAVTNELVSIWFAIGAIVSLICSFFTPIWAQVIIFVAVSAITLLLTRPALKKILARQKRNTNTDDFIGKRFKALTDIDKFNGGSIKINDVIYKAILKDEDNETIEKDSLVEIITFRGNKVVVRKVIGE